MVFGRLRFYTTNLRFTHFRFSSTACKRTHIRFVDPASVRWFPGHMHKGMHEINKRMALVDVIIEVHDARIPFSGRSNFLQRFDQIRPHILILNKMDLAEKVTDPNSLRYSILEQSKLAGQNLLGLYFTHLNSPEKQQRLLYHIVRQLPSLVQQTGLCLTSGKDVVTSDSDCKSQPPTLTAMAAGIPNCGKSTLINALRAVGHGGSGRAARVGRLAGQTKSVGQPILVSRSIPSTPAGRYEVGLTTDMRVMMLDTPGILEPKVRSLTEQLSLCVCGALDLNLIDREVLVDYLLFWWNHRGRTEYVSVLGLPGPTDNVTEVLARVCAQNRFFQTLSPRGSSWQACDVETITIQNTSPKLIPDFHRATAHIMKLFDRGAFGRTTFLPSDEQAASQYFVLSDK